MLSRSGRDVVLVIAAGAPIAPLGCGALAGFGLLATLAGSGSGEFRAPFEEAAVVFWAVTELTQIAGCPQVRPVPAREPRPNVLWRGGLGNGYGGFDTGFGSDVVGHIGRIWFRHFGFCLFHGSRHRSIGIISKMSQQWRSGETFTRLVIAPASDWTTQE